MNVAPPILLFFLAARFLRESPVTSLLLVMAISAGVAFQIPNVANLAGYRAELLDQQVSSGLGNVRVHPARGDRFHDATKLMASTRALPGVAEAQPLLALPASLQHGSNFVVLPVMGVRPEARSHPYEVIKGAGLTVGDDDGIMIGTALADQLDVNIGDIVRCQVVLATQPRLVLDDAGVESHDFQVRGFLGGRGTKDAYVSHRFLAEELGEENSASALLVYTHDNSLNSARAVAAAIESGSSGVVARSWIDDSSLARTSVGAIEVINAMTYVMSLFAVGVPVLALFYIDASHRSRQIALLSATGFQTVDIVFVFLLKAVLVGVLGVALGLAVGYGLIAYFRGHPIYQYEGFVVNPAVSARLLLQPAVGVFLTTILAGSYPAWRASRTQPSPVLRRIE